MSTLSSQQATRPGGKVVVVHSGARDRYQVALALSRDGLLDCLVTDFFWSEETLFGRLLARCLPARVLATLRQRSAPGLPASQVRTTFLAGVAGFLLDKARFVPFGMRRWLTRRSDARLGAVAGRIARKKNLPLLSYSYYAYDAFHAAGRPGMLFQMHPHPETMRTILLQELQAHPDCKDSLQQEWELNLPEEDFKRLAAEPRMASRVLAASSFTRKSLVDHGSESQSIQVIPYGIDLQLFQPNGHRRRDTSGPLKVLFVGRINQRKGIKYLLEALRLLPDASCELTICGRVLDGLDLFDTVAQQVKIRPSVSAAELLEAYQSADLFVLPSVGEGFGQVLLEALACGLPVLATTHTAAADLITEGVEGFVVEPRQPAQLAERMQWAIQHRAELSSMSIAARRCAERFPWSRFQQDVSHAVQAFLNAPAEGV